MLHRCPVITKSIREVRLAVPGPPSAESAADQEPEKNQRPTYCAGNTGQSLAAGNGGIHVYAHQRSKQAIRATRSSLEEVGDTLRSHSSLRVPLGCFRLMPVSPAEAAEGAQAPGGLSVIPWINFSD